MFNQKTKKLNPSQQMLSDPTMMTGMLKKNLNMIVPQMLTATWVNFFFTGFVVDKVPFPLTQRFRGMLQRGIELQSLDVTYISSLSWYFLNFFGLRGVFSLALGANELDGAQAILQRMAMGMDTGKAFASVREPRDVAARVHAARGGAQGGAVIAQTRRGCAHGRRDGVCESVTRRTGPRGESVRGGARERRRTGSARSFIAALSLTTVDYHNSRARARASTSPRSFVLRQVRLLDAAASLCPTPGPPRAPT